MKRVVTGHDAQGRSVFAIEDEPQPIVLDEGEVLLKAGDVLIQRATNHAWSNRGERPCRIAFVLVDAA